MAWWAWVLSGWVLLSIAGGLFLGALATTASERERRTSSGLPRDPG